ncbi:hypothetical protein, partial [Salmonella enterica]|nr:hypothetical protein [Salmonella enterica]
VQVARYSLQAGEQISLGAGQQMVVDGGASLTLQAGGQWITLSAGGIFSSTPIQLGGAPSAATAPSPLRPGVQETLLAVLAAPLSAAQVFS